MFNKILVANRGEIACRIIRTLHRLDITSVAVYSEADRHTAPTLMANEAYCIGSALPAESYLQYPRILEVAQTCGAEAIHPGYGFLSENAQFARACELANIAFIGPTPEQIEMFGLKHQARSLAQANGVPLVPGTDLLNSLEIARTSAVAIGFPVMVKSTAGGGGIGMQVCHDPSELLTAYDRVQRLSETNFQQSGIFIEKYIAIARHVEVQILGDGKGTVICLGDRDCSTQRRNQKVIEETPAPGLTPAQHQQISEWAMRLGKVVNYRSAGTVEFIYDVMAHQFYFLEVNTRLQVEHGITEAIWGIDLVEWMIRTAAGDFLTLSQEPEGHALEVRIYAEDPRKHFQPSAGTLTHVEFPQNLRVDSWIRAGTTVTPYYDPLLAKAIVQGSDRAEALAKMQTALEEIQLYGIETNLAYLRQVIAKDTGFARADLRTNLLQDFVYHPQTIDVIAPGTFTTIQDYPGRLGYWDVGVPPSGPMDDLAFRWANRLLGNPLGTPALEFTINGAVLKFNCDRWICLTGAQMTATQEGVAVPYWQAVLVKAGSTLNIKGSAPYGYRAYLAVQGGFDVANYLGSAATFTLGQFGGHGGRILQAGDVLHLRPESPLPPTIAPLSAHLIPIYADRWEIAVLYGPHGAPDFFTEADIETFFNTDWQIHHNSARTGIRLIGAKPQWARQDGGEAGLHPSNIHDNAYAIGTIDFTGDMPIILGVDGPSLGGFVCPATIVKAELWKMGQLRPGDRVRFRPISYGDALAMGASQDQSLQNFCAPATMPPAIKESPILRSFHHGQMPVVYRQAGDAYILIEYGELVLDLGLRFRIQALMEWLKLHPLVGIIDLTPGIRSLQIHFDHQKLPRARLLEILQQAEQELGAIDDLEVPTRIVNLPISWDDDATRLAIQKYMQSVRDDAPWCPSNLEFIRRINGLSDIEEVKRIFFDASYLVLGLGDVYLGAPVATPIDPRHRLVTTKYNPARTWTPENAVGIGGAYLCIYGMEGPGGYQFTGRTIQVWNRYHQTPDFPAGKPWLLNFFDRLQFYPVSAQELLELRADFLVGKFQLRIEHSVFKLRDYQQFLLENAESIALFKQNQQLSFQAERDRWRAMGEFDRQATNGEKEAIAVKEWELPPDCIGVISQTTANIWRILVTEEDEVTEGMPLIILEVMKMEISILAESAGKVVAIYCQQGQTVNAGQTLLAIENMVV